MSELFDDLSRLFDEGHRQDIPDLLTDRHFARGTPRAAAVLIAVTERPVPGALLIHRPHDMRSHPGQVAFPGGKIDPGEDAITAALREADEELGISPQDVRIIGATDPYQTGTGFDVTPVLGVIPPDLPITPNPAEVADWFEAPLRFLLDPGSRRQQETRWRGDTRRYYEMDWQGHRIWGVTAAIIANLSRRLAWQELLNG